MKINDMFYCDICSAPMVLEKKFKNHTTPSKNYRRRRFKCTVCDYQKTIYAGGELDEKYIPERGIEVARKIARQDEENRIMEFEKHNAIDIMGNCFSDADPGL